MEKITIVAVADNYAIGKDNTLLWHISEDLKFFKRTTSGYPVIMGRKTFESIGRALPKRVNIVVSRGFDAPEGVILAKSLHDAFNIASNFGAEKCFVMGGGQLYKTAMEEVDSLCVTHVHTVINDADTYFPVIDEAIWKKEALSPLMKDEESGYTFEFVRYIRK